MNDVIQLERVIRGLESRMQVDQQFALEELRDMLRHKQKLAASPAPKPAAAERFRQWFRARFDIPTGASDVELLAAASRQLVSALSQKPAGDKARIHWVRDLAIRPAVCGATLGTFTDGDPDAVTCGRCRLLLRGDALTPEPAPKPETPLPPSLQASIDLYRADPEAWHAEWKRSHDFKVNLLNQIEELKKAPSQEPLDLRTQLDELRAKRLADESIPFLSRDGYDDAITDVKRLLTAALHGQRHSQHAVTCERNRVCAECGCATDPITPHFCRGGQPTDVPCTCGHGQRPSPDLGMVITAIQKLGECLKVWDESKSTLSPVIAEDNVWGAARSVVQRLADALQAREGR